MSLTTLAKVLQTLGLTNDATAYPAISVAIDGTNVTAATVAVNAGQTTLTVTPTPGSPTVFTLTNSAYDTISELVAGIEALAGIEAVAAVPNPTETASTLLVASQSLSLTTSNTMGMLTYTNPASGTVSALLTQLILDADAAILRFCNRTTFDSASLTERYDGTGTPWLQLNSFPVASIASIVVYDLSGNTQTVQTTQYSVDAVNGRLCALGASQQLISPYYNGSAIGDGYWAAYGQNAGTPSYGFGWVGGWPEGFQNIGVTYTAGYATIPDDLSRAATQCVVDLYLSRRQATVTSGEGVSGFTRQYRSADDWVKAHEYRLQPFRRMAV